MHLSIYLFQALIDYINSFTATLYVNIATKGKKKAVATKCFLCRAYNNVMFTPPVGVCRSAN